MASSCDVGLKLGSRDGGAWLVWSLSRDLAAPSGSQSHCALEAEDQGRAPSAAAEHSDANSFQLPPLTSYLQESLRNFPRVDGRGVNKSDTNCPPELRGETAESRASRRSAASGTRKGHARGQPSSLAAFDCCFVLSTEDEHWEYCWKQDDAPASGSLQPRSRKRC